MTATVHGTDLGDQPAWGPELPGRYRLGGLVGVGGTASVYRATDVSTGTEVAVKVLHATSDPTVAARFAGEVRLLRGLHHPGLARIVDAGLAGPHPFLVTRFVDGETLQTTIRRGPMDVSEVTALGARLASTLAHVHAHGVVHRDVKPANILLDGTGRPFLTDFGVSRLVEATQLTETGATVGTPAYMAPEQVRGSRVGPAADVYALGLVLLEALTGRREYPGGLVESAVARLHRSPRVPAELPTGLAALLRRMTADDPDRRPDAGTVATRLAGRDAAAAARGRRVARVLAAAVALGVVGLGVSRVPDLVGADAVVADTPAVLDAPAKAGPDPSTDGGSRVVVAERTRASSAGRAGPAAAAGTEPPATPAAGTTPDAGTTGTLDDDAADDAARDAAARDSAANDRPRDAAAGDSVRDADAGAATTPTTAAKSNNGKAKGHDKGRGNGRS
ncbi:serine/threonine protein kinase [Pseudonocardia dioxanivorans CB1190]|uniref:non-specific serine/threonine protein kinase n=1 Tax=Pseudonocardia dioxanivorans (strain ATCC 55486 / DSM 44775 / JCM 13855 / CB1190) TaxID=675635 RepID=F4CUT3_PSEUX|nr:serine/threonine-protein kinase [Pseudonocardia dioxanivorans]AEA26397.1 serine/threonine protein kinase [Pseudonocardia dioxanivorans CB1190]